MKSTRDSREDRLENVLLHKFAHISFDREIRTIAEQFRDQAISEIKRDGEICGDKQKLIESLEVVRGARKDEYLVVSDGEYGKDLEYGTRNSLESPWFIPAFVTVTRSIHKCLHGALKRALLRARRSHTGR